jgi:Ca-activated chloride channel family protein
MKKLSVISIKLVLSIVTTAVLAGYSTSKTDDTAKNTQTEVERLVVVKQPHEPLPTSPTPRAMIDVSTADIDQPMQAMQKPRVEASIQFSSSALSGPGAGRVKHANYTTKHRSAPQPEPFYGEEQNTENYTEGKINPVYTTGKDPVSTFSIDVDTASYSNVRHLLNQGIWPDKGAIRVEEMINYFSYNYAQPKSVDQPFAIHTEVAASPWNQGTHLMRIALKGYQVPKDNLPPMNLVFLIDVSSSMSNADKLPLLKQAFTLLTKQLRAQDHVSMVVYAGASGLVLEPTTGDKQNEILTALDRLSAGGSTNGGAGIELAYKTASSHFNKDGINRVILATDGDFNVGTTSSARLNKMIEKQKDSGVFLSVLGFGQGNYNDHLMEELSNIGNGTAYYIDSFKEARKVFADGLTGTLQTIAKDVKIQVEFNPAYVSEYRLIGYDNRQLKTEDFNNDKVDAGDIGSGHTVTAFYELVMVGSNYHFNDPLRYETQGDTSKSSKGAKNDEMAYVKLRYKKPDQKQSKLIQLPILTSQLVKDFAGASNEFKFATAVAAFGEKLRGSQYIDWSIEQIKQTALANIGKDTWGYRHEFVQLTDNAKVIETK